MDNAQKAIIIGVGLFITIALISAVMLITGIGTDMMNNSNNQLKGVSASVSSQILADYDDKVMTGANVIATIKKFYDKENFLLLVDGKSYSTLKVDNIGDSKLNENSKIYEFSGKVSQQEEPDITGLSIKSTDNYHSYAIYQKDTDTILGIYFTK